ncbi:MAG: hypothetical protein KME59_10770 [Trichormus sp. ATA11-4-KO1]|jgi:hypothetical protein|nr:hypothetical protein [Trichormus sp. ATA11-4-KO1]
MSLERFGIDPDNKLGLSKDCVVTIQSKEFGLETITKIDCLIKAIETWSRNNTNNKSSEAVWFTEQGFNCQVLRTSGGGWIKGRFRFRLEFVPEQPEIKPPSPLDNLRSNLGI